MAAAIFITDCQLFQFFIYPFQFRVCFFPFVKVFHILRRQECRIFFCSLYQKRNGFVRQSFCIGIARATVDIAAEGQTFLSAVFIVRYFALQNKDFKCLAAAVEHFAFCEAFLFTVSKDFFQKILSFHPAYPLPPTVMLLTRIIGWPTSVGMEPLLLPHIP